LVNTLGSGHGDDEKLGERLQELVDLRPASIIERFELKRPIYRATAAYGHFGEHRLTVPSPGSRRTSLPSSDERGDA
jgi:S-adenosylmethionine synthetase